MMRRADQNGEALDLVQTMFGPCKVPLGAKADEPKGWKVEEEKRTVTRKECKRLREEFEAGGFMAQKVCGTLPKRRCWRTEEPCPKEDGELIGEYKAMHEENFLSSRLRGGCGNGDRRNEES